MLMAAEAEQVKTNKQLLLAKKDLIEARAYIYDLQEELDLAKDEIELFDLQEMQLLD